MPRESWRAILRTLIAVFYGAAGALHLYAPEAYLPIMPSWVPAPYGVVIATGLCEIAGAAALLAPGLRRAAGILLALYAVCVFPANIKHAFEGIELAWISSSWFYHGPRLVLQPAIAWLALYASGVTDWPFRKSA